MAIGESEDFTLDLSLMRNMGGVGTRSIIRGGVRFDGASGFEEVG